MKNLLLLGDSIRVGYCGFVKELLNGRADVFYPEDNCRFAQYTLRELQRWVADYPEIDIVHWNNGLWDNAHLSVSCTGDDGEAAGVTMKPANVTADYRYDEEAVTPPEIYEYMLNRVAVRIRQLCPKAQIIFATTTPVIEEEATNIYRSNAEVDLYNDIARKVMRKQGIMVNELGNFARTLSKEYRQDWVHYNAEGNKLLAKEIVEFLDNSELL
jgi:hypothetical protein